MERRLQQIFFALSMLALALDRCRRVAGQHAILEDLSAQLPAARGARGTQCRSQGRRAGHAARDSPGDAHRACSAWTAAPPAISASTIPQ